MLPATQVILFDANTERQKLFPLAFTRAIASFRMGILTIQQKWQHDLQKDIHILTRDYLQALYPSVNTSSSHNLLINAAFLPKAELIAALSQLQLNQCLYTVKNELIAAFCSAEKLHLFKTNNNDESFLESQAEAIVCQQFTSKINNLTDIFANNAEELVLDYNRLTLNRTSANIDDSNICFGKENIFIEAGAKVRAAVLNAEDGPIYIGKNATIMEGSMVRGPFAMCENAVLKLGSKIYGPTTLGPFSKVGGELNNSVFFGYSNKGHDGFLGNSVIGEWCNLGADTNNSNLKNTYGPVKLWHYPSNELVNTNRQFCGLIMGDHAKCGINTMFNTGTVVGVGASIFGAGFPPKFIPSFSWGLSNFSTNHFNKFMITAERVMQRRNKKIDEAYAFMLKHVFYITSPYRRW